jgi:hypothetical protein
MTWKQFKEIVDAQMVEKGISEDSDVWVIDISFPDEEIEFVIYLDPHRGLWVTE